MACCGFLLAIGAAASAGHPVGPEIGNNRYKTVIDRDHQDVDRDDYTAVLAAGDRLTVTVKSPFQSPLLPAVQLLDPDGNDRSAEATIKERSAGKVLTIKGFEIDRTGRWAVRISGRIATEGTYVVSFKIGAPAKTDRRDETLGGDVSERTYAVDAVDGSALDVDVSWSKKRSAPVELVAVLDPSGNDVQDADGRAVSDLVRTTKKGLKLRKLPLTGGDGAYGIRLGAADGPATYRIRWRVRPVRRATGSRKLDGVEPLIIRPSNDRILGVEGQRVRIESWNLSTAAAPRVLFGTSRGTSVIVDPSGGFLDVTVPAGVDDSLVAVTIINPDDQGCVADDLFYYVPEPSITAVLDADGAPVVGGDAAGGTPIRIEGSFLRTGQLVRIGNGVDIIPLVSDGGLEVITRAHAPGTYPIRVVDSFDHDVAAPEEFEFKAAPAFDAQPYTPGVAATDGHVPLLIRGVGFEATDVLTFDGVPVEFEFIAAAILRVQPPARPDGFYALRIRDRFGLIANAPDLRVKAPGVIDSVTALPGASVRGGEISIHGGARVEIGGSLFASGDLVHLGGRSCVVESSASEAIVFEAPAAEAGVVDLVLTDQIAQATAVEDALRYTGYRDRSAARAPSRSTVDDGSARRGAVGDLDGDGDADDVVLVSHDSSPGSRSEKTRILIGAASGALADGTETRIPSAGSDASGVDDLRARAVAIGDLDGVDGVDVVLAGAHPATSGSYGEVRLLVNDGYGDFELDEDAVPGSTYVAAVTAEDENGVVHEVRSVRVVTGTPSALAIGDLDGDGDLDIVLGRDAFQSRRLGVDAAVVDFTQTPPYVSSSDAADNDLDRLDYFPAVRVLRNDLDDTGVLTDVTESEDAIPTAGDDQDATPRPAFHTRDLALVDLDSDDDLDIVLTWDDPTTVSAYGLAQGPGTDSPRVATRILLNDGDGAFSDATADWMPGGSAPEWFQATRLAVADLDDDGDPDLVLVHDVGVDAYQGAPGYARLALRVLRNDHDPDTGEGGLTNVSATVLPAVSGTSNDNYRGDAVLVADVDGDGALDILVATTTAPRKDASNQTTEAVRLLSGTPGELAFRDNTGFLPPLTTDSGEANELLLIHDLSSESQPTLLLLSETVPATSTGTRFLRAFDWQR